MKQQTFGRSKEIPLSCQEWVLVHDERVSVNTFHCNGKRVALLVWVACAFSKITGTLLAETILYRHLDADLTQVPRTFLTLAHSIQAQEEMNLPPELYDAFDRILREADRDCLRVRHESPETQWPILAAAEKKVAKGIGELVGAESLHRLRQLELQGQGVRAYVRPEVIEFLQMDADQVQQLRALFDRTDQASRQSRQSMKSLYSRDADANEANTAAVAAARVLNLSASEVKAANRIITHEQRKRFQAALGTKRDTSKFDRVYAQAPELIDSGQWYQDRKTTLQAHRGKVILLHFYAFQCHNCHANFPIYNRWQEKLMEKGAVVIGIQTPETRAESEPDRITQAAAENQFDFPVLYDLEKENWNVWSNNVWPAVYVIDKRGYIRYWWLGELQWQGAKGDKLIERLVSSLLLE